MKKTLLAIALLAVGAGAASPYFFGSQIEKTAREQIDISNQQVAKMLIANPQIKKASVKVESYEKGYMDSTAKILVTVALNLPMEDGPKTFEIPFNSDIKHGPYLGDAGFGAAKLVSRPDLSGLDLPDAINADTFIVESVVGFSGDVDQKATVAPIKYEAEDGTVMDFAGAVVTSNSNIKNRNAFSADMDIQQLVVGNEDDANLFTLKPFKINMKGKGDADLDKGSYEAKSGVIEATMGEDIKMAMQSFLLDGTYEQAKGVDLMLGDAKGVFKDMTFTNPEVSEEPIKLPELSVSSSIKQVKGTDLDIIVKYAAVLDASLMKVMQSPVDVQTADLEVQFKGLPVAFMERYMALVQALSTETDQDKVAAQMQAESMEIAQVLIKNASAMRLELNATTAEGDLKADVDVGFKPGLDLSEQDIMMLAAMPNPQKILSMLVGRGQAELSKGITDKAGMTAMIPMMAGPFVKLEGESFKSDVQIQDGQLMINGTPLPMGAPAPAATMQDDDVDMATEEANTQ